MNHYQINVPGHGVFRFGHPTGSETIPTKPGASNWAITEQNWISSVEGMYFLSHANMQISTNPLSGSSFVQCDNHVMCAGGSYSRIALKSIKDEVAGGEEEHIKDVDGYLTLGIHHEKVEGDRVEIGNSDNEPTKKDIHISACTVMNENAEGDIGYTIGDFSMTVAMQTFVMSAGNSTDILHPALEPINPVESMPKLECKIKFGPAVEITNTESFSQFEGVKMVLNLTDCNYFYLNVLNNESKLIVGSVLVEKIKGKSNKFVLGSSIKLDLLEKVVNKEIKAMQAAKIELKALRDKKADETTELAGIGVGVYGKKEE